jgi:hypothetical protein
MGFFSQVCRQFLAVEEFTLGVSLDKWTGRIDWSFGIGFGETCNEGDWDFVVEFFGNEVDNFLGDLCFSGFGFAGSGSGFSH